MQLTEAQVTYKGIRPLQRLGMTARAVAAHLPGMLLPQHTTHSLQTVPPDPWPGNTQNGRDMIAGVFDFAGQAIAKDDLSWEPEIASPEWVAELHGFEWLRDLRSVGGDKARRMAREMVATWIAQYPKYNATTWREDVMGTRLKSWISFHDFFCASADDRFRKDYFSSLAQQAQYLSKSLPGDLSGIPLLLAYRGLAYTGLTMEGGEKRLQQAFQGIITQIREQILPDGGHISRSPQAAFEFLQCLVDLRAALIAARKELPPVLQDAIDRIVPAVKFFRHGDGALAQFNGGQECNTHLCDTILMHSGARGKAAQAMSHSGYEKIIQGRSSLIMDAGLPLVSEYSDRAHSGLLSFEYSYGRDRVIVNCGSSAAEGKWRKVLRSTLAHSTLTADNRNSCQFDTDGRLSSRASVRASRQENETAAMIEATHNGYVPRFGLVHRRCVKLQEQGDALCGEDQLAGKSGVPFTIRFHLHPDVQPSLSETGEEVVIRSKAGISWRFSAPGMQVTLEDSIYAGGCAKPAPTMQIILTGQTANALTTVNWEMRREKV